MAAHRMYYPKNYVNKVGKVEGVGFKDKNTALKTLKLMKNRDPVFQKRSITTLMASSRSTLRATKCPTKRQNILEAREVFEQWLEEYKNNNMQDKNYLYLKLDTVKSFQPLMDHYAIENTDFIEAYAACKDQFRALRNIPASENGETFDIVRNKQLMKLVEKSKTTRIWTEDLIPTKLHAKMISWAYSPDKDIRLKNQDLLLKRISEKLDQLTE